MNIFKYTQTKLKALLFEMIESGDIKVHPDISRVAIEPPRDRRHGDVSTNIALVLSKQLSVKPQDFAKVLCDKLAQDEMIEEVSIAGPGFINMRFAVSAWHKIATKILEQENHYGACNIGQDEKVNVEYISTNPTGPLHVGHLRGAVFGDALANLLIKAGYQVTKEYYVNDAGSQIDILARSAYLRYREAQGEDIGAIPSGLYPGDYLVPIGQKLSNQYGDSLLDKPEAQWLEMIRPFVVDEMMKLIREDLGYLGVHQDVFSSEKALHESGTFQKAMKTLEEQGYLYYGTLPPPKGKKDEDWEPRTQLLFRATQFGDDVDRPLQKSDGSWTYFASDIAYHYDKYQRGFKSMIDVWGADHGGYCKRIIAVTQAVTQSKGHLDVKICQIVRIVKNGVAFRMSKRTGNFVTLRELLKEVGGGDLKLGAGPTRFMMLTRKNDAQLDFDLELVKEQTRSNPVFYVQYAHARYFSLVREAQNKFPDIVFNKDSLTQADFSLLATEDELSVLKLLGQWERVVEIAALAQEPHRVAYYLSELAGAFHGLWTRGRDDVSLRMVIANNAELTKARVGLACCVRYVIASGLDVLGVEPLQSLH